MAAGDHLERVEVTSHVQLRDWLEVHHSQDESVWLVTYKKRAGDRYVSREQVLDELVAFGWIDGARRKLDDDRTMQLIGPRRVLHWAKSYKDRAQRLIAEERMHPAGLAAIEASEAAGLWGVMDDVDALVVPDDLATALLAGRSAEAFAAFPPSYRRNVLRWIAIAKTPSTRQKRIDRTVEVTHRGERIPNL